MEKIKRKKGKERKREKKKERKRNTKREKIREKKKRGWSNNRKEEIRKNSYKIETLDLHFLLQGKPIIASLIDLIKTTIDSKGMPKRPW